MFKNALFSIVALASLATTAQPEMAQARDAKTVTAWTQNLMKVGHVAHDVYKMNVAFYNDTITDGDASPIASKYEDNKCNFILRISDRNRFLDVLQEGFNSEEDRGVVAYAASLHERGHCLTHKQELAFKDDRNNELAQDIFALAYIARNNPEILNKAVRVFDHMRNDHQEEGSHAFGYDYRQAVNRIQAMPADYTPMQIARKLVYNTEVASK